ncbi:hypothetical protein J6590_069991 [Homalodisca vitripennis]|nr:hypothetical protein J6590_069991 [Homalodisca vitripennis]
MNEHIKWGPRSLDADGRRRADTAAKAIRSGQNRASGAECVTQVSAGVRPVCHIWTCS